MRLWAVGTMLAGAAALAGCGGGGLSNEQQAALVQNAVANAEAIAENVTEEARNERLAARAPARDAWIGTWTGVEGLMLTIEKGTTPGRYRITNKWSLDDDATGTFNGYATEEGIGFRRPDGRKRLHPGDGQATGLKWLAEKKDCLIVAPGEGYCRD